MSKLKVIDSKISNWIGVWWHPEKCMFTSAAVNISELRKYKGAIRVCLRKNKNFKAGSNRPNYTLCIRDAKAGSEEMLELFDEIDAEEERKYTKEEVIRVMHGACRDGQNGYSPDDLIISDYI